MRLSAPTTYLLRKAALFEGGAFDSVYKSLLTNGTHKHIFAKHLASSVALVWWVAGDWWHAAVLPDPDCATAIVSKPSASGRMARC